MKIAVADNNALKFTHDLIEHWKAQGHEVKYESGASEYLAQWADLYYIDTWDNNIHYLWKLYHGVEGVSRTPDWDNNKKPKVVVRALDWEVWIGLMRDQAMIDWVDKVIFIAPHIADRVNQEVTLADSKQEVIRPGVNLGRFTKKRPDETDGFQLGMVLGDMWKYKNHMGGLDIFTTLYRDDPRWQLHVRGQQENSMYDPENWLYYLKSRGIANAVTLYERTEDMNAWYEKIDILLHPGQKEAFCYAVGEAMAKDIPVVVNDFLGSDDIWPSSSVYQTHAEAVNMIANIAAGIPSRIQHKHTFISPRQYMEMRYDVAQMCREIDDFLEIK